MGYPEYPAKPVDGYELVWWSAEVGGHGFPVRRRRAIYHVNTPWRKYAPRDDRGGAALVDDWMLYPDLSDRASGRNSGWHHFREANERAKYARLWTVAEVFVTQVEAVAVAIARLENLVETRTRQMNEAKRYLIEAQAIEEALRG